MLYDDRHPSIALVLLMIREAVEQGASRIDLIREERQFSVNYSPSSTDVPRDQIDNRFWHTTLGALHCLAAQTVYYDAGGDDSCSLNPPADTDLNSIFITERFPNIDNCQLRTLRDTASLPVRLCLSFTDRKVTIEINP